MVISLAPHLAGLVIGLGAGALVYLDADGIDMDAPLFWAGLVAVTVGVAMALAPLGSVPVPGMLALGLLGPVVYLFERDDSRHDDSGADPHTLDGPEPQEDDER